jgi:predicted HAD superfamily Cof-like phosphohydrolase
MYDRPTLLQDEDQDLHLELLDEEWTELETAIMDGVLPDIADGITDMIVILTQMAAHMGLPLDKIWKEVHRANMSKLGEDGKPILREDGKFLKGPNYCPPRIKEILDEAVS